MKVEVACCMCPNTVEVDVALPAEWTVRGGYLYEEQGFCSVHAPIEEWAADQCPGCVGGWGDCGLWDSFAYSGGARHGATPLTDDDFAAIRSGVCPKRTGGTLMVSNTAAGVSCVSIDLSTKATVGGDVLAEAIDAYIARYGKEAQR